MWKLPQIEKCTSDILNCVNCGGKHSAGYGGCPRYRHESQVQSVLVKEKVNCWEAREKVRVHLQTPNMSNTERIILNPEEPCRHIMNITNITLPNELPAEIHTSDVSASSARINIPAPSLYLSLISSKTHFYVFTETKQISVESINAISVATSWVSRPRGRKKE